MSEIQKPAIDIGIVTNNLDAMLAFYGEILALPVEAVIDMPGGGVMHRFKVGDSIVKVISTEPAPQTAAAPGGIRGATGYRYWTLHVTDLQTVLARAEQADHPVVVAQKTIRRGVDIAIVADPDGNWVELLNSN